MIHDDLLYDGPRLQWRGKGLLVKYLPGQTTNGGTFRFG
jgi:hypothetical protein